MFSDRPHGQRPDMMLSLTLLGEEELNVGTSRIAHWSKKCMSLGDLECLLETWFTIITRSKGKPSLSSASSTKTSPHSPLAS